VRPEFPLRLAAFRGQPSIALPLGEVMNRGALARGEGCAIAAVGYSEAVLDQSRMAWFLARAQLSFGEWLRRENRRIDARKQRRGAAQGVYEARNQLAPRTGNGPAAFGLRAGARVRTRVRVRSFPVRQRQIPDERRAPAGQGVAVRVAEVGVYLTDGVFLYRVDDLLVTGAGEMVDLEDCYRLDVVRVPVNDLRARRLQVVTPTPSGPHCDHRTTGFRRRCTADGGALGSGVRK